MIIRKFDSSEVLEARNPGLRCPSNQWGQHPLRTILLAREALLLIPVNLWLLAVLSQYLTPAVGISPSVHVCSHSPFYKVTRPIRVGVHPPHYYFIFSNYNRNRSISEWGCMLKDTGQQRVSSSLAFHLLLRQNFSLNSLVLTSWARLPCQWVPAIFCLCLSPQLSYLRAGVTGTCYLQCFYVVLGVFMPIPKMLYQMGHLSSTSCLFHFVWISLFIWVICEKVLSQNCHKEKGTCASCRGPIIA